MAQSTVANFIEAVKADPSLIEELKTAVDTESYHKVAKAHGFDPSYDLKFSDDGDIAAHHEDDTIRVLLTRKELDRRLKSIHERATSHLRETGHHTLHLAIGFVQWFEDNASDIVSHAPLLLLPVSLEKDDKRARKEFRLGIWEGGLEINVALIEKAREHWGLQLPALRPDDFL